MNLLVVLSKKLFSPSRPRTQFAAAPALTRDSIMFDMNDALARYSAETAEREQREDAAAAAAYATLQQAHRTLTAKLLAASATRESLTQFDREWRLAVEAAEKIFGRHAVGKATDRLGL